MRIFCVALAYSFIVHGLLLYSILRSAQEKNLAQQEPLLIQFEEASHTEPKSPGRSKHRPNFSTEQITSANKKSIYGKFHSTSINLPSYQEFVSNGEELELGWNPRSAMGVMQAMKIEEVSENNSFFQALGKKINKSVGYPDEFAAAKIVGDITLKVTISKQGQLLKVSETTVNHPALKTYVIYCLFKSLNQPLPKQLHHTKRENIPMIFRFKFNVVRNSRINPPPDRFNNFKNSYQFFRDRIIDDVITEVKKDFAKYIPPIVPTPMGPIVDFVQLYKMIKSWNEPSNRLKKKRRLALTKKRFENMLKQQIKND